MQTLTKILDLIALSIWKFTRTQIILWWGNLKHALKNSNIQGYYACLTQTKQKIVPDEFVSKSQLSLMLCLLQLFPSTIDVTQHFAFFWSVRFLIVSTHLALNCEQKNLQITFLREPVTQGRNMVLVDEYCNLLWILDGNFASSAVT